MRLNPEDVGTAIGILLGAASHVRISYNNRKADMSSSSTETASVSKAYRIMFDAANPDGIPISPEPEIVAWYPYSWKGDIDRFSTEETVIITIDNDGDQPSCDVLDVETGAATFAEILPWLKERQAREGNPLGTIYVDQSNLPTAAKIINKAVQSGAIKTPNLWVADWTGTPHVFSGSTEGLHLVATQYQSSKTNPPSPGDYDLSLVSAAAWHPLPAPTVEHLVEPVPEIPEGYLAGVATWVANGSLTQSRIESRDAGKTWTVL
jgi:hypothetical protein